MLIKPCDSIIEFLPVPKSGTHHFAVIMTVVRVGEEEQESESLSLFFFPDATQYEVWKKNKSAKANQSKRERRGITSERGEKSRLQTEFRVLLHISGRR